MEPPTGERLEDANGEHSDFKPPVQKPTPVLIHHDSKRRASGSNGDGIPLSHLRKRSTEKMETGQPSMVSSAPQSPTAVASSTGSAVKSTPARASDRSDTLNQPWPPGSSPSPDAERMDSVDLDVERGMKLEDLRATRAKNSSKRHSALGHVQKPSDATRNSQLTSGSQEDDEWNEAHPCFTHPNPHVPAGTPEIDTTKVIRIPREYMMNGDISPAYSIVYPDILRPYLSEEQFRMIIDKINEDLRITFDPWNKWNILDVLLGLFTFWLVEDIYPTFVKRGLRKVESFIEEQNQTLDTGAKIISLRRTGYINLDIQIPDPFLPPSTGDGDETSQATAADHRDQAMKEIGSSAPLSDAGILPTFQINGDTSLYTSHDGSQSRR